MRIALAAALIAIPSLPALAAEPQGEEKLAKLIAGRTAGASRSCIPQLPNNQSTTVEKVGVVYDVGGTRYVSRFQGGCEELSQFTMIVTRTPTTQLCEGDIAEIYTNPAPSIEVGSCTFGPFVPYTKTKG